MTVSLRDSNQPRDVDNAADRTRQSNNMVPNAS
jgi:hypothetical protein